MAASSAADPWALPEDAAAKYDAFFTICASGGSHVNRTQAGPLFERAELPPQQMAIIWSLSDIDLDGRLNSNEFRVAMHLATLAVAGQPLPSRLPPVLELIARGRAQPIATATARFGAFEPTDGGRSPPPLAFAAGTSLPPIAPHDLAHYRAVYLASEPSRGGGIDGEVGARVLAQSGLPQQDLGRVWDLADLDQDGRLDLDEFAIAMHLCTRRLAGDPLPAVLPPSLHPPFPWLSAQLASDSLALGNTWPRGAGASASAASNSSNSSRAAAAAAAAALDDSWSMSGASARTPWPRQHAPLGHVSTHPLATCAPLAREHVSVPRSLCARHQYAP
jgi:hypothetical protein